MDDRTKKKTNQRRLAFLTLCALLLTLPLSSVAAPPTPAPDCDIARDGQGSSSGEAGNTRAEATPLLMPTACAGSLTADTDEADWYKFPVTVGMRINAIEIVAVPQLFAIGVKIYDSAGVPVTNGEGGPLLCQDSTPRDVCANQFTVPVNDTFYLELKREVGSGSYQMRADASPTQADCGTPGDANTDRLGSTPVDRSKHLVLNVDATDPKARSIVCTGSFDSADMGDGYTFFVPRGAAFDVDLTGIARQTTIGEPLTIEDRALNDMTPDCVHEGGTATMFGVFKCKATLVSGLVLLGLRAGAASRSDPITYTFTLTIRQDDCGADPASNNDQGDAPDTAATLNDRKELAACLAVLDAEPATTVGAALDVVDLFRVSSDAATLTFSLAAPDRNCVTLKITSPAPASALTTHPVCGSIANEPLPGEGSVTVVRSGGAGTWSMDVLHTGLTPGADPATYKGGHYTLAVGGTLAFEDDCSTGADVSATTPLTIDVPTRLDGEGVLNPERTGSCSGDLRTITDTDAYAIPGAAATDIVTASVGADDAVQLCLFDPTNAPQGECGESVSGRVDSAPQAGTWKVIVQGASTPRSNYGLSVAILSQRDCGDINPDPDVTSFIDAGNTAATATFLEQVPTPADDVTGGPAIESQTCALSASQGASGQLRHAVQDNADWYEVRLDNQYTALVATLVQETLGNPRDVSDFDLCVIPPGAPMRCSTNPPSVPDVVVATPTCAVPQGPEVPSCAGAGRWKIGVLYKAGPLGAYRLAIAGRN